MQSSYYIHVLNSTAKDTSLFLESLFMTVISIMLNSLIYLMQIVTNVYLTTFINYLCKYSLQIKLFCFDLIFGIHLKCV